VGPPPEVDEESVGQQCFVLGGDEAHLGMQLCRLLADVLRTIRQFGSCEDDGFTKDATAFRSSERDDIDAGIEGHRSKDS
ncbi:MAG: hypothetical protein RLZZ16_974, partial [Actinomycetota bacterium]